MHPRANFNGIENFDKRYQNGIDLTDADVHSFYGLNNKIYDLIDDVHQDVQVFFNFKNKKKKK